MHWTAGKETVSERSQSPPSKKKRSIKKTAKRLSFEPVTPPEDDITAYMARLSIKSKELDKEYVIARERVKQARKVLEFALAQFEAVAKAKRADEMDVRSEEDRTVLVYMPKFDGGKNERV